MEDTLAVLRDQVRGPVFGPEDPGYAGEVASFNTNAVHRAPIVVGAESAEDVAAAVRFATARQLPVRLHATGHGTEVVARDGVLVSTRRLRELVVDPAGRSARVGAGVVWSDVVDAAAAHDLGAACGSSPGVGVVGYLTGGGVSPIGRTYGFGADHVSAMELVTADGMVRRVGPDADPDLFWALRGGRAGVGIVTSVTMGLFPLASLYGGGLFYGAEHAYPALRTWTAWTGTLSDRTTTSVGLLRVPDVPEAPEPLRGRFCVHIRVAHIGDDDSGAAVVAPLRTIGEPLIETVGRMPFSAIAAIHGDPTDPLPYWSTGCQLREFPEQAADALLGAAGPDRDLPLVLCELRQFGGAYARSAIESISGRDASFVITLIGAAPTGEVAAAVSGAADTVLAALAPWTLRGPQVNSVGDAVSVATSWPPEVYDRLVRVKEHYDPSDVFRFGVIRPR